MSGREKGVASAPCPECGRDLAIINQPDGGVSTEACGKCFPAAKKSETEKAAKAAKKTAAAREVGTETEETQ